MDEKLNKEGKTALSSLYEKKSSLLEETSTPSTLWGSYAADRRGNALDEALNVSLV